MDTVLKQWRRLTADRQPLHERLFLVLPAACCLCLTLLFFAPVQIYLSNVSEFWFSLSMFWKGCLLISLLAVLLCLIPGLVLRGTLLDLYVSAVFGTAVLFYLQGNFLNISYGELNGQAVDWTRYGRYALINTAEAVFLLLLPACVRYFHRKFWSRMVRFVSVLILCMQAAGLIALYLPYRKTAENTAWAMGWDGVSEYSGEQNLVLIILDSFDEPYFAEYLSAHPEERSLLDGFTYYRNTAGISSSTLFSMVPMLTGKVCTWEEGSFDAYLQSAWAEEKLFHRLSGEGFDIRALTASSSQYGYLGANGVPFFGNRMLSDAHPSDWKEFYGLLYSLAFYTYLPHVLKPGFWIVPDDFSYLMRSSFYRERDPDSYVRFGEDPVRSGSEKKTFRLYHFKSMHPPLDLGSDAQSQSRFATVPLQSEEGSFRIVHRLLDQMKEAGVYDASSIIIAADHASTDHVPGYLNSAVYCPLLLFKPRGAAGSMKTTSAPASLFDIRATFLKEAGLPYEDEGMPLSLLTESTERIRCFYRHLGTHRTLYEFTIGSEDANDINNYTLTGTAYVPSVNP